MRHHRPAARFLTGLFLCATGALVLAAQPGPGYKYTELQPLSEQQQKKHDDCMLEHMDKAHSDTAYRELGHICYRRVLGYR